MTEQGKEFTFSLLAYAVQKGISLEDLCSFSRIDLDAILADNWSAITAQHIDNLWKHAGHLSNDPLFGLHFGESLQISALGAIGEIIKSSNTVREALEIAFSLVPLITDRFTMQLSTNKKNFIIALTPKNKKLDFVDELMADFFIAFTIHELDGLMLKKIRPDKISIPRRIADATEYERVLRCDQIKNGKNYSITLALHLLETPILTANHHIQTLFLEKIKYPPQELLSMNDLLKTRVYNFLISNSYLKVASLEDVASNFNISPRTFQRRLKEEGVTFQEIADSVRKSLAIAYIKTDKYPIKEISYILGYNDMSAFSRAFRRWTGKSPIHFS